MKYILLFFFVTGTVLFAKEPFIAILQGIYGNDSYMFRYKNTRFLCRPYGVVTVDALVRQKNISTECKEALQTFLAKYPDLYTHIYRHLYLEQSYHVVMKPSRSCIVFSRGRRTASEELLSQGIAILEINFFDELYNTSFRRAQRNARIKKRGIWKIPVLYECLLGLNRKFIP